MKKQTELAKYLVYNFKSLRSFADRIQLPGKRPESLLVEWECLLEWGLWGRGSGYPIMRNIPNVPIFCFGDRRFRADERRECIAFFGTWSRLTRVNQ